MLRQVIGKPPEIGFQPPEGAGSLSRAQVIRIEQIVEHVGELTNLDLPGSVREAGDVLLFALVLFKAFVLG